MFATSLYTLSSVVRVLGALACADVAKDRFLPCSGASGSSEEVYLGALFQPVLGRANGASLLLSRLHFCAAVRLLKSLQEFGTEYLQKNWKLCAMLRLAQGNKGVCPASSAI